MRGTFVFIMAIFFESTFLKDIWWQLYLNFSQQLRGTLATAFWKTPCCWRFYGHECTYMLILSSRLRYTSWRENRRRSLENYQSHKNPSLWFEDHYNIIFICFVFSQTNLGFEFNLVLIGRLCDFCHSCFTFSPFDYYLLLYGPWCSSSVCTHLHKSRWSFDGALCLFYIFFHKIFLPVNGKN